MSRIGKMPINVPDNVDVKIEKNKITVSSPKGELSTDFLSFVTVSFDATNKQVIVDVKNKESVKEKPYWGLYRSIIANMIKGVSEGYEKKLELNGVGFSCSVVGTNLNMNLGFSHPVSFPFPAGVTAKVEKNLITISGIDKQQVGQFAAIIRKKKKVDPYKLKGIKYVGEIVIKKAGKMAKSVGK